MRKIRCFLLLLWGLNFLLAPLPVNAKTEEEYQAEIQALKTRNTQLEKKMEEVTADLQRSTDTITVLKKQMAEITTASAENVKEVNETRAAMKEVKSQLKTLLEQQQAAATGKASEAELAKAVQRVQQLEKDLKKATAENEDQKKTIERLKKTSAEGGSADLKKQLEEVQTELQKQQKQFKATVELLQDREGQLKEAQTTVQTLKKQLAAGSLQSSEKSEARVTELEATLADVNAKLIKMAQEKSTLEAQLKGAQAKPADRSKDAEIARLEGELRKAADYINTRDAEIVSLTKAKTDVEAQFAAQAKANAETETQLTQLATSKTDLATQLAALTKAKTDLETQAAALTKAKTDLEAQLTERAATLQNQTTETTQLKNTIGDLQAKLDETTRKNAQSTKELAEVKAELQQTGSVPDEAKKRIQELTQELQDVKTQVDNQQRAQTEYPKLQQEASACRDRVAELTKSQERCQALQTQLQEAQATLAKAQKEASASVEQSRKEVTFAVDQSRTELETLTAQNRNLKKQVEDELAARKLLEQKYQGTFVKDAELEKKYAEGRQELELKEQLLQQTLIEKALLEKKFDEGSAPYKTLQTQLKQAETKNAILEEQIAALHKTQGLPGVAPQETASDQPALQQEQTLRKQAETDLIATRNHAQALQQQISALSAQLANRPGNPGASQTFAAAAGVEGLHGAMRALFPPEISQRVSGGTLTMLGWSPNKTKLAYQESSPQAERLWIFNTLTKQSVKLTEWQNPSSAAALAQVAWAADNEYFLAVTGVPGKYVLALGNSGGLIGNPVLLNENEVCFAWSPTQQQFAYFSGANLIIQEVSGKTLPLQLGRKTDAPGTSLQWSPDGAMIAFSMKRDASFDIFTLKLSAGEPVLQTLVASPADDLRPAWSPDGNNVAFYVRAENYDTKLAITPADRSRPPYIVAHNTSLPLVGGPQWVTNTEILYMGEERLAVSQNSIYLIDIGTGPAIFGPAVSLAGELSPGGVFSGKTARVRSKHLSVFKCR